MFRDLPEKGYLRVFVLIGYGLIFLLAGVIFFRWLWKPLLPFLLASVLALLLQKPLDVLDRWTGRKKHLRPLLAALLVLLAAGILSALLIFLGSRLFSEIRALGEWLVSNIDGIGERFEKLISDFRSFLSSLPGGKGKSSVLFQLLDSADTLFTDLLSGAATAITAKLPAWIAYLAGALPGYLLTVVVMLVSCVYLTADGREIGAFLSRRFPERTSAVLRGLRGSLVSTILLYGRAYAIIIAVTFSELYVGFLLLHVPYSLAAASFIAIIDILPVLGTGTVLLPWALFAFLHGAWGRGIGLLILYIVITVVRQVIEPKIIGRHIGLHPLAALFAMYLGIRIAGLPGLLFLPIFSSVLWKYFTDREKPLEAA